MVRHQQHAAGWKQLQAANLRAEPPLDDRPDRADHAFREARIPLLYLDSTDIGWSYVRPLIGGIFGRPGLPSPAMNSAGCHARHGDLPLPRVSCRWVTQRHIHNAAQILAVAVVCIS